MVGHIVNSCGLILGMAGVILIFVWGPPQPNFDESVRIAVEEATVLEDGTKVADIIAEQERLRQQHGSDREWALD
jgi:hypothetical protein